MKKHKVFFAATMLIFVAALLLSRSSYLVLSDTDTGKIYQKFGTDEVVTFEIEFTIPSTKPLLRISTPLKMKL